MARKVASTKRGMKMAQHKKQMEQNTADIISSERPRRVIRLVELKPAEVAFLGEFESDAATRSVADKSLYVQVLCWSRTAQGWAALNESWDSMKAYRDESTSFARPAKGPPPPPSWVYGVAPKLGAPFRDNPAEESTLAAWVSRAQLSFAVAIIDKSRNDSEGTNYRAAVLDCLGDYQAFLESPAYEPCRLIMTAEYTQQRHTSMMEAFKEARVRLQAETTFESLQMQSCSFGKYPLPLDLANLASAAIARYLNSPLTSNPIYDAIRIKMVQIPRRIMMIEGSKRR